MIRYPKKSYFFAKTMRPMAFPIQTYGICTGGAEDNADMKKLQY